MNNTEPPQKQKATSFLVIGALFALFFIPMMIAWVLVHDKYLPGKRLTNHGELIQPPRNIVNLPLKTTEGDLVTPNTLRHKWVLLYVKPGKCHLLCQQTLYNMRQVHLATGKNIQRIKRAMLTFTGQSNDLRLQALLTNSLNGTEHFVTSKTYFTNFTAKLPSQQLALTEGYLYLIDPLGNVIMGYPLHTDFENILKDLQHLLQVSQIG